MPFFRNYIDGVSAFITASAVFFRDRSLWKYACLPMLLMTALYVSGIMLVLYLSARLASHLEGWIAALPRWISWAAGFAAGGVVVIAFLLAVVIAVFTVSAVYEIVGGPFFDRLILRYEEKYHGEKLSEPDLKKTLLFMRDAAVHSLTTFLGMLFWMAMGLLGPAAGPAMLFVFLSVRLGAAFVMPAGFLRDMGRGQQRRLLSKHTMRLLGFGSIAYLVQLIPAAPLLLLPGLILGGSELLHRIGKDEDRSFPS